MRLFTYKYLYAHTCIKKIMFTIYNLGILNTIFGYIFKNTINKIY